MVSRLMFSLKKTVAGPAEPWSLSTIGDFGRGMSSEGGTLSFAPQRLDASHEISGALAPPNEEVIELGSVPQLPLDSGSQ